MKCEKMHNFINEFKFIWCFLLKHLLDDQETQKYLQIYTTSNIEGSLDQSGSGTRLGLAVDPVHSRFY